MAISPKEYRQKITKTVVAPSGAEFVIKKVRGRDFVFSEYIPIELFSEEQEITVARREELKSISRLMDEVIIAGVIEPKIVDKDSSECTDDELSIKELTDEDSIFLFNQITEFSGLGVKARQEVQPFPEGGNANSN